MAETQIPDQSGIESQSSLRLEKKYLGQCPNFFVCSLEALCLAAGQQNHFIVITLYQQQPSSHSNLHGPKHVLLLIIISY